MALPKIVFHNVTNGLTAEIILSEEIDKNAIIEIPSDDSSSVTDGSGNKLIKLTTHEQMKRLLNQMTTDFNNIFSTMRRELTNQFQNINSAITNEASQRLEQDRNIISTLGTEIQDRKNADNQLQQNINNEAQARQNKDSNLQTQINEKVPVGTIIPVLRSINGQKKDPPTYIRNNYLKCDGSVIPTNYTELINTLYPNAPEGGAYSLRQILTSRLRSLISPASLELPNYFSASIDDFNKIVGFDIRRSFYKHMESPAYYITLNYVADIYSLTLVLENLGLDYSGMKIIYNEQSVSAENGYDWSTRRYSAYTNKRYISRNSAFYIQIADKSTNRIIHETILITDLNNTRTNTSSFNEASFLQVLHNNKSGQTFKSFKVLEYDTEYQKLASYNTEKNYQYLGCMVTKIDLDDDITGALNGTSYGYLSNINEIQAFKGDFRQYMADGTSTIDYAGTLSRYMMSIEDFSKWTGMPIDYIKNNFYEYGLYTAFPSNRRRFWLGIRPDGRLMQHNEYEYFPYNACSTSFGISGYAHGLQIRDGAIVYIRITNRDTGVVEQEYIYSSRDKTTGFTAGDTSQFPRDYPSFKNDNATDEDSIVYRNYYGKAERDIEVYRLPFNHEWRKTQYTYREVIKVYSTQLGSSINNELVNRWRYKYSYDYSGSDTSITGIEYNPYGGLGRFSMPYLEYIDFMTPHFSIASGRGRTEYRLFRLTGLENSKATRVLAQSIVRSNRAIIRLSAFSKLEYYIYNTFRSAWETYNISTSPGGKVWLVTFFMQSKVYGRIVDLRNANKYSSTYTSGSYVHNNSWCDGRVAREYIDFKHPESNCSDYTLMDYSFDDRQLYLYAYYYTSTTQVNYTYQDVVREDNSSKRLPDLTNNETIITSGPDTDVGNTRYTTLPIPKTIGDKDGIYSTETYLDKYYQTITVEYWIKF